MILSSRASVKMINGWAARWMPSLLILEKVQLQTSLSWMGTFPLWMVFQQMQNENGWNFLRKQRMMLRMVLITLLQSIAAWRYFCSKGKSTSYVIFQVNISFLFWNIDLFFLSISLFSVSTADSAAKHWKKTQDSVNDMENKHVSAMGSLIR